MIRDNLLYNRQSQTGAFGFGGFEELKNIQIIGDSGPGIGHF
jgi:hypothetical protein